MGRELSSPRRLVRAIKKYNRYNILSGKPEFENRIKTNTQGAKGIDSRDIYLFVALRHGLNLSDKKFTKYYNEVINDYNTNPSKLVDEYFNWYEKINYRGQSSRTNRGAEKLIMVNRWSQQYGTILDYNKEAFDKRYDTIEKKIYSDSLTQTNTLFCSALTPLIRKVTQFDVLKNRYYDDEEHQMYLESTLDSDTLAQHNAGLKLASISEYQKGKRKTVEIEFPEVCMYSRNIYEKNILGNHNVQVPEEFQDVSSVTSLHTLIDGSVGNSSTYNGRITNLDQKEFKSIYIDGQNLYELMQANPNFNRRPRTALANLLLSEAVMQGKAIDVCQSYIENNGRIATKIVPISFKPDAATKAKMHDDYLREHHPIRYRFFNWGPFRLKKVDVLKKAKERNLQNMEARHAIIFQHRNTTYLDELNAAKETNYEVGRMINKPIPVKIEQPKEEIKQANVTTQQLIINDQELGNEINNVDQLIPNNELSKGEDVKEV